MWNTDKQRKLDELRVREADGILTKTEWAELEALFGELDAEEAETMRPAFLRQQQRGAELREEKTQLEAKVQQLKDIVREQEGLLTDARSYLDRLRAKRSAIADKYYRITGHELPVLH